MASYFGPREDMKFLELLTSDKDTILVVQKIKPAACEASPGKIEVVDGETHRATLRRK